MNIRMEDLPVLGWDHYKSLEPTGNPVPDGPYRPNWDSLAAYQVPDWFRDAKFGIWGHWGVQCQPGAGDWYARHLYIQGTEQNLYHNKKYGHPADAGLLSVIHEWRAEEWDPAALMKRYKAAGARFFVGMACHHDNLDNFDSAHHEWNSTRVGPRRDIIGEWSQAARELGMRFGVSNHAAHAWHWMQPAYGYDGEGPRRGERYDAYNLTKEQGKGTWWEGLDPQNLYAGRNIVMADGVESATAVQAWHEKHSRPWDENPPRMNPGFSKTWFLRHLDLLDKYRPDFVFMDDFGLPLGQHGLDALTALYNRNAAWHDGKNEAVLTVNEPTANEKAVLVENYERGMSATLQARPWLACSCIGDWHYKDGAVYKSLHEVTTKLVDVVSKNGTLLLNIPLRGSGALDAGGLGFLDEMARWMAVHGEAIYDTRPWKIFGEGPTQVVGGMFSEKEIAYTAQDLRFTTKGADLFVFGLAWPEDGLMRITSLQGERLSGAVLLGSGPVELTQNEQAWVVRLPARQPKGPQAPYAVRLRRTTA